MAELLIPTDGERAVLTELSSEFPEHDFPGLTIVDRTVGTKIPTVDPKPGEFVRVMTVGGAGRDIVTDTHTIVIEGWSRREQTARDLCALSVAIVQAAGRDGLLGGMTCYGVTATIPANLPHPDVPTHFRFTSTLTAMLRRVSV